MCPGRDDFDVTTGGYKTASIQKYFHGCTQQIVVLHISLQHYRLLSLHITLQHHRPFYMYVVEYTKVLHTYSKLKILDLKFRLKVQLLNNFLDR